LRFVSQDTSNAGFDPLAAPPRDECAVVNWPILAQLPWMGEPEPAADSPALPEDVLPFVAVAPSHAAPPVDESGQLTSQLRYLDPTFPSAEDLQGPEPVDLRLHRATAPERRVAEPPHLNLHLFPSTPAYAEPASEAEGAPIASSPTARWQRRIDPPQALCGAGLGIHQPNESLAAQLYQWQTMRRPQTALIAMSLLLLSAGGIYLLTLRGATTEPQAVAQPPAWEIQPISPGNGGINETLATPLPANPPLDLSTGKPAGPAMDPATDESQRPMPNRVGVDADVDDPIARWLNEQAVTPRFTASKDAAEFRTPVAKPVETVVEKPVTPTAPTVTSPATSPEPGRQATPPDQSITPTIAPAPTPPLDSSTLSSPYPTTPYPPFPATLALPTSNAWSPAMAETLGPTFGPPQPPR
jgi:hypothetical protein